MLSPFPEYPRLTAVQRDVLRAQKADKNGPGTVVRDFDAFLNFIAGRDLAASGVLQLPPIKVLAELNDRMARPIDVKLKRAQWKSFPHLFGLYLLIRATGLVRFESVGAKRVLRLDQSALTNWCALNSTEKYFALLESWLRRADDDTIGEVSGLMTPLQKAIWFWRGQIAPDSSRARAKPADALEEFRYWPGLHHLALFEEFGFVTIDDAPAEVGKGWNFKGVKFTNWGEALWALLVNQAPELAPLRGELSGEQQWDAFSQQQKSARSWGEWQNFIAPYFPDWQSNFTLPELAGNRGVCVFKVSVDKVWRRIAIASTQSLNDLSDAILRAFQFDFAHLCAFSYRNRLGVRESAVHPFMEDEAPLATEVIIGDLPLRVGDAIEYVYDFGDYWQFSVQLEKVGPPDDKLKKARVLEKHGDAPQQYADWDD